MNAETIDGGPDDRSPARVSERQRTATIDHLRATLGNRFEHVRLLGLGGMGEVHLARDRQLGRQVAIKCVTTANAAQSEGVAREARLTARIESPHVVTVHDVAITDNAVYIISEYIEGKSLDRLDKPISWTCALDLALDLARGLATAHQSGVLHRDIKPGNAIWDDRAEHAKLIDFGVATLAGRAATRPGRRPGTPAYLAPELWDDHDATPQSDVYSFGVLVYELCTGRKPAPVAEPDGREATRLDRDDMDHRFVAIVNRCLALDPGQRYATGQELADALAALHASPVPPKNPYRGLLAFQRGHRHVFFGRDGDIDRVVDRLAARPLVVLVGNSGVGKSSLAHAGVLPRLLDHAQACGEASSHISLVPGRRPLGSITRHLARYAGCEPNQTLTHARRGQFAELVEAVCSHSNAPGLVLFIDQLEELVTLSDPDEAALTSALLAELIEYGSVKVRILAAVRGDQLSDLADMPGLGRLLQDSLYLVRSLDRQGVRQAIEQPAHATGVRFESSALIDTLVAATLSASGGLPLLQFALAELWDSRDRARSVITERSLDKLGGVAGALARHAETTLAELSDQAQREAVRRMLVRLVTLDRTRARCTKRDLVAGQLVREYALEHLVKRRLLVCHEVDGAWVYALVHEALLTAWPTLRDWLNGADKLRAVKARLAGSARDWHRLGWARATELLWGRQQLREAEDIEVDDLSDIEVEFLAASRRAVARKRMRRWLGIAAAITALGAVIIVIRWQAAAERARVRAERSATIDRRLAAINRDMRSLRARHEQFSHARQRALDALRVGSQDEWPRSWQEAMALEPDVTAGYRHLVQELEAAFGMDPARDDVRVRLAQSLDEYARFAELTGREVEREHALIRLATLDAERARRWRAPVTITVITEPAHAKLDIWRYVPAPNGRLEAQHVHSTAAGLQDTTAQITPGSYLIIVAETDERSEVRYPFVIPLPATESLNRTIVVSRPRRSAVPDGFVYVPPGSFMFGYGRVQRDEVFREWYGAPPLHSRHSDGYVIARYEVTYASWLEFAAACADKRCPGLSHDEAAIESKFGSMSLGLTNHPDAGWEFAWLPDGKRGSRAAVGQQVVYKQRNKRSQQDWLRFPVAGVSLHAVQQYVRWLRDVKGMLGAALCTQEQWERAARGADDRILPHGERLDRDDANFDKTYGQNKLAFGPDEVGAHPQSASPFGVHDMAGNVFEMTRIGDAQTSGDETIGKPASDGPRIIQRGGSFYHATINSHVVNRWDSTTDDTWPYVGFRVCASAPVE